MGGFKVRKEPSSFKHNTKIKTHRCIQVQDMFNLSISPCGNERFSRTIKELDEKGIDYYTKTTIVYYLPKEKKSED
jgi:hypothetical protein